MDESLTNANKNKKSSTWKTLYLIVSTLHLLELVAYACFVIWFAPLLDATFSLFTHSSTWKWIFPLLALPIAFVIYYIINSFKSGMDRESGEAKITLTQIVGLLYIAALIVILIFNIIEWVNHCTSSVAPIDQYAFCYDGLHLVTQYKWVFWLFAAHLVLFSVMLWMAWYAMSNKLFKIKTAYVNGKAPSAAYYQMQQVDQPHSQKTVFG
jgi:hypothetical protein